MRVPNDTRKPKTLAILWLALLLGGAPPAGATPSDEQGKEAPEPAVEEHVEVRLVQMQILARDRKNRPITDLSPEEIKIKDRGEKLKAAFLEPIASRPQHTGPVPDVRLYLDAPGGWGEVATASAEPPRHVAIFIDIENDPPLRRGEAMQDVIRFVRERLGPGDRVAVYSYTGEVHEEIGFTPSPDAVASAVMRAFGRPPRADVDVRHRMRQLVSRFEDCIVSDGVFVKTGSDSCLRAVAIEYADERRPVARDYVAALNALIRLMGGLRGDKIVLAVSHGVAVDPTSELIEAMRAIYGVTEQLNDIVQYLGFSEGARTEMDELLKLAVRERVVLHFVDRATPPQGDFGASRGESYQPGAHPIQAAHYAAQADLEEIAATTGGVLVASPELFEALDTVAELNKGTYLLGYYIDEYRSAKDLAKVKVGCKRKGVQIVHRRGYYMQAMRTDIVGSIRIGRPDRSEIPAEEGAPRTVLPFRIELDPETLGYEAAGAEMATNFTVHVQVQTDTGLQLADAYHFISHAYPLEVWQADEAAPVTIGGWVDLPPGSYRLLAYLRNPANGDAGEFTREIELRPREPASPE